MSLTTERHYLAAKHERWIMTRGQCQWFDCHHPASYRVHTPDGTPISRVCAQCRPFMEAKHFLTVPISKIRNTKR